MRDQRIEKRLQWGVGLVEVLVALLIVAIGVLGFAGMQLQGLNSTEESHYRTQATALAQDIVERISANQSAAGVYRTPGSWQNVSPTVAGKPAGWDRCITGPCSAADMAANDILQATWYAAQMLPGGLVMADGCGGPESVCVTVSWGVDPIGPTCDFDESCVILETVP